MYRYLLPMLAACAPLEPAPVATPEPTATPKPVPEIMVPSFIPVFTPFAVVVCDGSFQTNRRVFVDGIPLGTMGWNSQSGCHQIIVPGLSGAGIRTISVDGKGMTLVKILPKQ
jgi:hypothetical protein